MSNNFESRFVGGAFLAASLMLWLGWFLLPVKPGTFLEPSDFERIHAQFHLWIWMYRLHLFGMITTVIALFALAARSADSPGRVLVWPGAAVTSVGMVVGALGEAFYYHHGAWGSLHMVGQPPETVRAFLDALRFDTEYVTCFLRFGRVFGGLGLVVLAWGALRFRILPKWSGVLAGVIGVSAMALTMAWPDNLPLYRPIFHTMALWMLTTGIVILRRDEASPTRA